MNKANNIFEMFDNISKNLLNKFDEFNEMKNNALKEYVGEGIHNEVTFKYDTKLEPEDKKKIIIDKLNRWNRLARVFGNDTVVKFEFCKDEIFYFTWDKDYNGFVTVDPNGDKFLYNAKDETLNKIVEGEKKDEALRLYHIWSAYGVETEGVLVAYASIHGNTAKAAEQLAEILKAKGAGKVAITDLSRDDMAEAIEDAFRMDKLALCCATFDGDIFPAMHLFLHKLRLKGYQNRRVALVENGSWAPQAVRVMKEMLAGCKNVEIVEPTVTIRGSLKPEQRAELEALANALLAK